MRFDCNVPVDKMVLLIAQVQNALINSYADASRRVLLR